MLSLGLAAAAIAGAAGIVAIVLAISNKRVAADTKSDSAKSVAVNTDGGAGDAAKPTAEKSNQSTPAIPGDAPAAAPAGDHPIDASLAIAHRVLDHIDKDVKDYTCTFVKTERIDGELIGPQQIAAKVRQKPSSVYFKFLKPDEVKGREVIFIAVENGGKFVAREGSGLKRLLGAVWLQPTSALAMAGQRYPVTGVGMRFLTNRLIEVAEQDRKYGEVEVKFYKDAKVNGRNCLVIEVMHPTPRRVFLFHKARVYIDDELQVPIHYEAYLWPKAPGEEPPLDESYSYLNLKLNVGLTDADFDYKNPKYGFVDK
jgi:outer membrane lipoprotein-sorting protein